MIFISIDKERKVETEIWGLETNKWQREAYRPSCHLILCIFTHLLALNNLYAISLINSHHYIYMQSIDILFKSVYKSAFPLDCFMIWFSRIESWRLRPEIAFHLEYASVQLLSPEFRIWILSLPNKIHHF